MPQNCDHPIESRRVETTGYITFVAGDVVDTLKELVICLDCGKILVEEDEHDRNENRAQDNG